MTLKEKVILAELGPHMSSPLQHVGSVNCGAQALVVAPGLSCPTACGIFVPQSEPASPALEGRFLTTGWPRKSSLMTFKNNFFHPISVSHSYDYTLGFIISGNNITCDTPHSILQ